MTASNMVPIHILEVIAIGAAQPGTILLPSARTGPAQLICGTTSSRERVELAAGENGFQLLHDVRGSEPNLAIRNFTINADLKSNIDGSRGGVPLGALCLSAGSSSILVKARMGNALVNFDGEVMEEGRIDQMVVFTAWSLIVELSNGERRSLVEVDVATRKSAVELL